MLPKQTSKHGSAQRSLASFFSLPSGSPINGTITTPAAPQVIEEIKLIQNIYEISRHTGIHLSFVNGKQPTMTGVNSRWHSTTIKRFCRNEQFGKKKKEDWWHTNVVLYTNQLQWLLDAVSKGWYGKRKRVIMLGHYYPMQKNQARPSWWKKFRTECYHWCKPTCTNSKTPKHSSLYGAV